MVYSLFQKSSYQAALKGYEYGDGIFDVKNEWFFMSREQIMELAQKNEMNDTYYDARGDDERFVYKYLKNRQLSEEARELLDAGKRFVEACFPKRFIANDSNPEYCLTTWDAGYYQNYKIYRMFEKDEKIAEAYQVLDSARTKLETKIRKRVYADGILTK